VEAQGEEVVVEASFMERVGVVGDGEGVVIGETILRAFLVDSCRCYRCYFW